QSARSALARTSRPAPPAKTPARSGAAGSAWARRGCASPRRTSPPNAAGAHVDVHKSDREEGRPSKNSARVVRAPEPSPPSANRQSHNKNLPSTNCEPFPHTQGTLPAMKAMGLLTGLALVVVGAMVGCGSDKDDGAANGDGAGGNTILDPNDGGEGAGPTKKRECNPQPGCNDLQVEFESVVPTVMILVD